MAQLPTSHRRAPVAQLKKSAAIERPRAFSAWRVAGDSTSGGGHRTPHLLPRWPGGLPLIACAPGTAYQFAASSNACAVAVRSLTLFAFLPPQPTPTANNPVNRTAGNRRRSGWLPRAASGYFQRWASHADARSTKHPGDHIHLLKM